uniref:uncharacterized protein LOC122579447 isoform X2 n=1 Tax=Erigeron canadensis TaxID=72917 RepID=UPI001CB9B958|nr:uncharacterized protein LOC122579447 isoform X2 [Erigeron canadensis]
MAAEGEIEELDSLFDYTRSCLEIIPLDDDDDDDDSTHLIPSKRRKSTDSVVEKGGEVINIGVDEDKDDDLEWLEPPPKVAIDKTKICENSVIKELRKKRQELMSFTESAKDVLQAVEESVKRDLETSSLAPETNTEKPSKAAAERPKIVISIQDKDGVKQFRVYMDDKFERLFKMYADKVNSKVESLVFSFDGDKVNPTTTPSSLGMEDEDLIEVCVKSS